MLMRSVFCSVLRRQTAKLTRQNSYPIGTTIRISVDIADNVGGRTVAKGTRGVTRNYFALVDSYEVLLEGFTRWIVIPRGQIRA
jgi:hypothetical protein